MNISGHSIGGKKSCLVMPEHKIVFDIGVCTDEALKYPTILVTHGHPDHLAGAVQHANTRSLVGAEPTTFVVPAAIADALDGIMKAWIAIGGRFDYVIKPMSPGEGMVLPNGLTVRVFKTDHVVPSQGYALCRQVKKLKAEYIGLQGQQLKALRESGTEIQETIETVEVVYTGDTMITAFDREPLIRKAKLLIHEATFVGTAVDRKESRRHGHTHLDELAERADLFENEAVLLCHFSTRSTEEEIRTAVSALPGRLGQIAQVWIQ